METTGGAGKDGTPHRKPPTQRHGPSLELFPESPRPTAQMDPLGRSRPAGWRPMRCCIEGTGSPGPSWRCGQGSGPGFPKSLPPQGYLKDKKLMGSRD